jgi:putative DNA primase/helicase
MRAPAADIAAKHRHPPNDDATLYSHNQPAEFADDSLALKFTERHGNDLRYTAAWGRWSIWDGCVWKRDDTLRVFDLARDVCRDASAACGGDQHAPRLASAATVYAVERLARTDRQHAATAEQWDADAWLLNTPGGVVELQTGKVRVARRTDYMTKITAIAPGGDCPLWRSFLSRITNGDQAFQSFLQRMMGYALTGKTTEHALFFLYGTGANGKSVLLNTISGVIGDYARAAPIETFIASKSEHHPTDLAGLQGARLITAVETEEGRQWAESKLKTLTGGDRISARFMRQDFFEYTPQFKLMIAGNHEPGLRTVDEAMRRRLHLLPFAVTIPASERDLELTERLRNEQGGILEWMIEGCLGWQAEGLHRPAVVIDATESYLAAEDTLARWIEDRCVRGVNNRESSSVLFADWQEWASMNEEPCGSPKQFSEHMEARGFTKTRTNVARGFQGIGLRTKAVTDVTD